TIKGPKVNPVRIGGQIRGKEPKQRQGPNDPAVGTVLAHAGAQISPGKSRRDSHQKKRGGERGQGGGRKESRKSAFAEDGEGEIAGRAQKNEAQADTKLHLGSPNTSSSARSSLFIPAPRLVLAPIGHRKTLCLQILPMVAGTRQSLRVAAIEKGH